MSKDDVIETEGKIIEALPNATFKVQLSNGHVITAYISGKLRMNYIRIIPGDMVKLEMSPYDLTKGRITWRSKNWIAKAGDCVPYDHSKQTFRGAEYERKNFSEE